MENPKNIKLISYPKSGSTYLRFILANLYWPDTEHDFDTVHKLIPTLDSQEMENREPVKPQFYKSHDPDKFDYNSFVIFRHIGDVLISFYHHNRKFYNLDISLEDYIESIDYGLDWRIFTNQVFNSGIRDFQIIKYENLVSKDFVITDLNKIIGQVLFQFDDLKLTRGDNIQDALKKSSFHNMQTIENTKGLGSLYMDSNLGIKFVRSGKVGQWKGLYKPLRDKILSENEHELKLLKYS